MIWASKKKCPILTGAVVHQAGRVLRLALLCLVLMGSSVLTVHAQDAEAACPCFSYEEIESIFVRGEQLAADEGVSSCQAEDYSVECSAEMTLWDQNYEVIAQASVRWYDFDPGQCEYVDTIGNPGVERKIKWPHPAPESIARACFDIIAQVIAASDSSGKCMIYP